MSEDIERLQKALDGLRVANDTAQENADALRDIISATTPVELETDPEGYVALQKMATAFQPEFHRLCSIMFAMHINIAGLHARARL